MFHEIVGGRCRVAVVLRELLNKTLIVAAGGGRRGVVGRLHVVSARRRSGLYCVFKIDRLVKRCGRRLRHIRLRRQHIRLLWLLLLLADSRRRLSAVVRREPGFDVESLRNAFQHAIMIMHRGDWRRRRRRKCMMRICKRLRCV